MTDSRSSFLEARNVLDSFLSQSENFVKIDEAIRILASAFQAGKRTYSCGNGGSMCDAMHFAEELSGRFRNNRPALPAMSISDPSHITCVANDYGFEAVFSRFLEAHGKAGDVLLAISTSGNSPNIIRACETARDPRRRRRGRRSFDPGCEGARAMSRRSAALSTLPALRHAMPCGVLRSDWRFTP
jgi:D-sedoheptulose 7-phosphate isomerase